MKVAFFSSANTIFTYSYIKLLKDKGFDVKLFNSSEFVHSNNIIDVNYKEKKIIEKRSAIKSIFKSLKLTSFLNWLIEKREIHSGLSENEIKTLKRELNLFNPDKVFFFWSTMYRAELEVIKSIGLESELILSVNTYPIRSNFMKASTNRFLNEDRDYFSSFNKLIIPSKVTEKLFMDSNFISTSSKTIICPDVINVPFESVETRTCNKKTNSLIFLGNTNFSESDIDDVSSLILELANKGIFVYIQSGGGNELKHDYIRYFEPFSFSDILKGKLAKYISSFNGVLFSYSNVNSFRYHGSVTTRLLLAESCGVKIYVQGGVPDVIHESLIDVDMKSFGSLDELIFLMSESDNVELNPLKLRERVDKITSFFYE